MRLFGLVPGSCELELEANLGVCLSTRLNGLIFVLAIVRVNECRPSAPALTRRQLQWASLGSSKTLRRILRIFSTIKSSLFRILGYRQLQTTVPIPLVFSVSNMKSSDGITAR